MSMQLFCRELHLKQTPTYITHLCLYANLKKRKKSPWRTVMQKYLLWVTEVWGNQLQRWDVVEAEKASFEWALKNNFKLHFEER